MENKQTTKGHIAAIFTIIVWGTTFISTKVLLDSFSPIEILFIRFAMGFIVLIILSPKPFKLLNRKQEWLFAGAGICGITLYYLLENIALTITTASNVSIVVAIAPFFTSLFAQWFLGEENPGVFFYLGFVLAITGIALISFNGSANFEINPLGDILAILASIVWAVYSILIRKITSYGYTTIQVTKRVFAYGIAFMIPAIILFGFEFKFDQMIEPTNLFNLLFLGVGASAICFVTWNSALKLLGVIRTSVYVYMVPLVTVTTSVIVLHEPLTPVLLIGMALTLAGLFLSERKHKRNFTDT